MKKTIGAYCCAYIVLLSAPRLRIVLDAYIWVNPRRGGCLGEVGRLLYVRGVGSAGVGVTLHIWKEDYREQS